MNNITIKKNNNEHERIKMRNHDILSHKIAKVVVIKGEKTTEFTDFSNKLLAELGPQTEIERNLCEKYIILSWKLRRSLEVERNTLNKQSEVLTDMEAVRISMGRLSGIRVRNIARIDITHPTVVNLTHYQFELEKRIAKTLDRLRAEQRRNLKQN